MTLRERFDNVLRLLAEVNPDPKTELEFDSPFHLLIAVILSAQCTDKRVNKVTPALFEAFPDVESLAVSDEETVYSHIKSISYPNNKARNLLKMARMLRDEMGGVIPSDLDNLMRLPGVGRKTANVMLAVVWNEAAMAVDTHVFRVSNRIGLTTNSKTPLATEKRLVKYIPEEKISKAHHWLILHGRYVCTARSPKCEECPITNYCRDFTKKRKSSLTPEK